MMDAEVLLSASGLELGYRGRPVLRNVNLEVRAGEFWFFVGPNGSGKTTLVRAILGILPPLGGRLEAHPSLAGAVGFVPQRSHWSDSLPTTVREFVLLGLAGRRLSRAEERALLARALRQVGLEELEQRDYRALSGGQRQRVLVARALVRGPRLLVLDEPTAGLDFKATETLMQFLTRLHAEERQTLVFVSHDLALAEQWATHGALFSGGSADAGPASEVLKPQRLARAFGAPLEHPRGSSSRP